jgi:V/A-type H+-transporting ATPase subunit E
MSLAEIKAKIESEAQQESRRILDAARDETVRVGKKTDDEIAVIESQYRERLKKEEPEIFRRREIVANLDVQKMELGVKQELIDDTLKEALRVLQNLPEGKYLNFVKALLRNSSPKGDEELLVGANEKFITEQWLSTYNEEHKTRLTLAKNRIPISGGFVLRQGDIDTNCSWDMLLRWVRDDIEANIVSRLFSA